MRVFWVELLILIWVIGYVFSEFEAAEFVGSKNPKSKAFRRLMIGLIMIFENQRRFAACCAS